MSGGAGTASVAHGSLRHRIRTVSTSVVTVSVVTALTLLAAACAGPAGAPQASTAPSGAAGRTTYPLTITQPDGTSAVIAAPPTRVIVIDNPQLSMDNLLAIGVNPIGGLVYPPGTPGFDARGIPTELSGQITDFTVVGTAPVTPDLEKIASLQPDLIVGVNGKSTKNLEQLKAIAPVVSLGFTYQDDASISGAAWVPTVRLLGQIFDRQQQADAFVAKFEAAAEPVRADIAGKTVNYLSPTPAGDSFYVITGRFRPAGQFLAYLGLRLLPQEFPSFGKLLDGTDGQDANFSVERAVDVLSAQYLVISGLVGSTRESLDAFLSNPVVAQVPAVKAGRVIRTTGLGGIGDGYLTAGAVGQLDALEGIRKAFTTTGTAPGN
ncbi:ABC transporter substrate-binding protein [Pseudonocardia sp. GCM10023141]|uniref:ABC transporter substrate-binding protein n=1 Tax=Pseudonocardia sp. GCM10023141 TaxID=3252653 RepID=UPI003605FDF4